MMNGMRTLSLWAGMLVLALAGASAAWAGEGQAPIRVGMTVGLSGAYSVPARAQLEGVQMWVSDINKRGALLGRKVKLVYYDDHSDPATSARLYEKLISEDHVDLLIGPYGSDLTLAASDVAARHRMPMVAAGAAADAIWSRGNRYIFGVDDVASHYMALLVDWAAEKGLKTVALVYAESDFPRQVAAGARARAAQHGMRVVYEGRYPREGGDYAGLVKAMRAAAPDVVIGGTYLEDSIAILREAKHQHLSPKVIAFTVGPALKAFVDTLGEDAEDVMGVVAWMPSAAMPMAMDFSYRYRLKYGHNASVQAALGYGASEVLEAAVRLAGSLDGESIRTQLRTMKFRSLLGRYQVDETGRQIAKNTYVLQIQDGHRVLVLPEDLQDAPARYPFRPWDRR